MKNKIVLCTTFPNWAEYPKQTLPTWFSNLPEELLMLISLDPCKNLSKTEEWLFDLANDRLNKKSCYISRMFKQDQLDFLNRNKENGSTKDYRLQYTRFSFKVFTLREAATFALEEDYDYLIWLDADVEIKKPITTQDIEKWLPKDNVACYLGRKDWDHSECGFMIFNLKNGGKEFINRFVEMYLTDEVLTLPQWHDSFVFDKVREEFNQANNKDVFLNLTQNISGRDVFDKSILNEFMTHKKGVEKFNQEKAIQGGNSNDTIDVSQLKVITKNCVDHEVIQKNIKQNLDLITKWLTPVKPHRESIVMVNAGPSLDVNKIKPYYQKGVKIVAVKHSLEKLLDAGIIPWACILLDPREHVKDFVKHPLANKVKWFVASMVNPEVTKILIEQGCDVWGYHAYVGAEEHTLLASQQKKDHILVLGGSATCTRGMHLLNGVLGFKHFILFAYDLCSLEKPDLTLKKGDRPIWMKTKLQCVDGNEEIAREFYTKGEFLAQVQELQAIFNDNRFRLTVHGDAKNGGIIPWLYNHFKNNKKTLKPKNKKIKLKQIDLYQLFEHDMPLTKKGAKIKKNMQKEYGEKEGKKVFYASANKGTIKGVEKKSKKK